MPSMHLHTGILDKNPKKIQYSETLLPTNSFTPIRTLWIELSGSVLSGYYTSPVLGELPFRGKPSQLI